MKILMSINRLAKKIDSLFKTIQKSIKIILLNVQTCSLSVINYLQLQKAIILESNYKHY